MGFSPCFQPIAVGIFSMGMAPCGFAAGMDGVAPKACANEPM